LPVRRVTAQENCQSMTWPSTRSSRIGPPSASLAEHHPPLSYPPPAGIIVIDCPTPITPAASNRMLKKSASGVLTSLRGSIVKETFRRSETLVGLFRSPRFILRANGHTKCGSYLLASSLAAALLDSLFEHPRGILPWSQTCRPVKVRRAHKVFPQPAPLQTVSGRPHMTRLTGFPSGYTEECGGMVRMLNSIILTTRRKLASPDSRLQLRTHNSEPRTQNSELPSS
jgi:hypothetical protein